MWEAINYDPPARRGPGALAYIKTTPQDLIEPFRLANPVDSVERWLLYRSDANVGARDVGNSWRSRDMQNQHEDPRGLC